MAHVSTKKIKKEVATELTDLLLEFLAAAPTKKAAQNLAAELLSQTERVMLAKRLAIVVLLVRGYSFQKIERALGMTRQTTVRVWRDVKAGRYEHIVRYARRHAKQFKKEHPLDAFIRVLHMGLPPMTGKRWEYVDKNMRGLEA